MRLQADLCSGLIHVFFALILYQEFCDDIRL